MKHNVLPSRNSPEFDIEKIERTPVLIIHGDKDERIPLKNTLILHENSKGVSELFVVDNAKHMVYKDEGLTKE